MPVTVDPIEYISAEEGGTSYPTTTIRVKPKETPLSEDATRATSFLENQTAITDLYSELSYDELKGVLEGWLNPTGEGETTSESSTTQETLSPSTPQSAPAQTQSTATETSSTKTDDVAAAFDDLFNS